MIMAKRLSEMSLEELWELFPIYLTEHQDSWSEWYEEEVNFLKSILPVISDLRINHIGSTAIHGIWAKPIIDILIEMPDIVTLKTVKDQMTAMGIFVCPITEIEFLLIKDILKRDLRKRFIIFIYVL